MAEWFSEVLNMSLTGSVIILVVLAARLFLKRAPKIYSYALWAVVLFRLLCPVSLTAPVSLLEWLRPQVEETTQVTSTVTYIPVTYVYSDTAPAEIEEMFTVPAEITVEPEKTVTPVQLAAVVWLAGVGAMVFCSLVQYLRLRVQLIGSMKYRGAVYLADHISSPFVLGVLRPRVYLPSDTPVKERRYIIAHERHHIRRGDHIIKLLAYAALCIHWFNPLAWIAFSQAGRDMEMSCDEAVIKKLGSHIRADYSASLLRLATGRRIIAGTPLAFGEGDTKGRVLNMAKWRKPKLWVSIVCVVLCVAVLAACAVNPEQQETTEAPVEGTWDGQFKLDLPEGYEFDRDEDGNMVFTDGETIIGGKRVYQAPEGYIYADYFSREFLMDMGLPEAGNESLGYSAGGSIGGMGSSGWFCDYFSDVPPGTERELHTYHQFFVMEDGVTIYDVWFDLLVVDPTVKTAILNSIEIPEIGRFPTEPAEMEPPAAFSEENINILITGFTGEAEKAVADTTLLISVDPSYRTVTLGTVLKDTYVSIPDYQGHVTGNNRFSACYTLGRLWGGVSGAEELVNQCMKDNFGITVDHNLELTGAEYAGLMDVLNDITGKLPGTLSPQIQSVSDRLMYLLTGSAYSDDILRAKKMLANAQLGDCTIPNEGDYIGMEMEIAGTMQPVLVLKEEPQEVTGAYMPSVSSGNYYRNAFSSTDGTVDFVIQANLPLNFTDVSILEAEPHYLTGEDVRRVGQAIFGEDASFTEKTPLLHEHRLTEEQLRAAIDRMTPYTQAEAWEELVGSGGIHGQSCEEVALNTQLLLESYQKKLANFRNDFPEEACSFTWRNSGYYIEGYAQEDVCDSIEAYVEMDGISYDFAASTWNTDKFKLNNIYVMAEQPTGYGDLDERILYRDHCRVKPGQMEFEAVVEKATKMLQGMELGQWQIDETYVEVIEYHHPDHPEYVIHLNAVSIIDDMAELRREQHSNINTASADKPEDNYYLTQAEFEFAPDGVLLQATIYSPMEVEEVSKTNMVHSTEGLMEIAEEILKDTNIDGYGLNVTQMGYEDVKCTVEIRDIRSGMARQRLHGTDATYQYFPALALYGNVTYEFANGDKLDMNEESWNLLTINALYGSVISNFGA